MSNPSKKYNLSDLYAQDDAESMQSLQAFQQYAASLRNPSPHSRYTPSAPQPALGGPRSSQYTPSAKPQPALGGPRFEPSPAKLAAPGPLGSISDCKDQEEVMVYNVAMKKTGDFKQKKVDAWQAVLQHRADCLAAEQAALSKADMFAKDTQDEDEQVQFDMAFNTAVGELDERLEIAWQAVFQLRSDRKTDAGKKRARDDDDTDFERVVRHAVEAERERQKKDALKEELDQFREIMRVIEANSYETNPYFIQTLLQTDVSVFKDGNKAIKTATVKQIEASHTKTWGYVAWAITFGKNIAAVNASNWIKPEADTKAEFDDFIVNVLKESPGFAGPSANIAWDDLV